MCLHTLCCSIYSFFCLCNFVQELFKMCHICDSYFYQLYLHSWVQPLQSSIISSLFYSLVSLSLSFLLSIYFLWPFSWHLSCSIMCALCVSGHFRATHFMSEVVVPIVINTSTWWGDKDRPYAPQCLTSPCLARMSQLPYKHKNPYWCNPALVCLSMMSFYTDTQVVFIDLVVKATLHIIRNTAWMNAMWMSVIPSCLED